MTARALQIALLLLVVGNLGRLPVAESAGKQAPFLVNDFALLAVLLVAGVHAMMRRSFKVDWPMGLGILFAIIGAVSAIVAVPRFGLTGFELAFSLAYLARWAAYFALYVAAVNLLRRSDVPGVIGAFDAAIVIFALFGIFQAAFLPGFAQIVYPESVVYADWDPQGHRLVSTFLDPNYAGALLVIALLIFFGRIAAGDRIPMWRVGTVIVALLLTLSRSSFLALAIGGIVIVIARGISARTAKIAAAFAVLLLPAVPALLRFAADFGKLGVDASALQRFVAWSRALRVLGDYPLFGVGFNTYGFVGRFYGFDASGTSAFALDGGLLFIAVMTGLVGLALYVAILGVMLFRCRRVWRNVRATPTERGMAAGVAAATVAMVVHSLFVNSLLLPFLMEPLWAMWALTSVVSRDANGAIRGAAEEQDMPPQLPRAAVISFPQAA